MAYDEHTVISTLDVLKGKRLVRFLLPSHGRTAVRYRHVLDEAWGLDTRQCAVLAVLLLRGPQTVGELRARTERMADFDSLDEVEHELRFLAAVAEPLARSLGRRPGQKEERWSCPLVATTTGNAEPAADEARAPGAGVRGWGNASDGVGERKGRSHPANERPAEAVPAELGTLRAEFEELRAEVGDLRRELDSLRTSLGG